MDLGSIVGMILVWALLLGAMALGVGIGVYIDVPSALIVVGGTASALMIGFKMETLKNFGKFFAIAFKPPQMDLQATITKIVEYATKARRDGILALEADANKEDNAFLKAGLSMAVDGIEPELVRAQLEVDMEQGDIRHKNNALIFDQIASFGGAMGMLGTLIGLVGMLVNMDDPSAIGPSMAVALLTTMYGSMLGNILGMPISNILTIRNADELLEKEMILEGIGAIQAGDNPRSLEGKLLGFLPPSERNAKFA